MTQLNAEEKKTDKKQKTENNPLFAYFKEKIFDRIKEKLYCSNSSNFQEIVKIIENKKLTILLLCMF